MGGGKRVQGIEQVLLEMLVDYSLPNCAFPVVFLFLEENLHFFFLPDARFLITHYSQNFTLNMYSGKNVSFFTLTVEAKFIR